VNLLILITTGAVFYLGYPTQAHQFPFALLIHTLLGTLLAAGGTTTLNRFIRAAPGCPSASNRMAANTRRKAPACGRSPLQDLSPLEGSMDLAVAVNLPAKPPGGSALG
jgi:hypothetical protein